MGLLQCLCQTIDFVRNRDQVDMVRHEAVSNESDAVEDDVLMRSAWISFAEINKKHI